MKTLKQLEENAHEVIITVSSYQQDDDGYCVAQTAYLKGYEAGSRDMEDAITYWIDPMVMLPEYYKVVEIKYTHSRAFCISTAWISVTDTGELVWTIDGTGILVKHSEVVGWRRINQ